MAVLSDSRHCSGKGEVLLCSVLGTSGCLSSESKPCCWGSDCACPPHAFWHLSFSDARQGPRHHHPCCPSPSRAGHPQQWKKAWGGKEHDKGRHQQLWIQFLFPCPAMSPSRAPWQHPLVPPTFSWSNGHRWRSQLSTCSGYFELLIL